MVKLRAYEAADLAPDTYEGEYFQPSVKVYKKDDADEEIKKKDELLKEMAKALEEVVRCLSHGLQDCRASVTAKAMLQKYYEQNGELK